MARDPRPRDAARPTVRQASVLFAGFCVAAAGGCGVFDPDRPVAGPVGELAAPQAAAWALVGVDVLPMTADTLLRDQSLVVRAGRIVELGARADVALPPDLEIVDGTGWIVLPGLADMHVHLRSAEDLERLLDAGVTFVRNMWGTATTRTLIGAVLAGRHPGPRIASAGPGIDGSPPIHPGSEVLVDPANAAEIAARQIAGGWPMLKVYQGLSLEAFDALADAARSRGAPLVGHVPTEVPLAAALPLMRSIEHLEGYGKALTGGSREPAFLAWARVDAAGMSELAAATAEAGTWICPTLLVASRVLNRNLPAADARRAVRMRARTVRHLDDADVPLLAGTDAGVPIVDPGVSLHDELDLLVEAGLTRSRVLRMATADAARFLGWDGELGTIRPGARADLLVVRTDPRKDLGVLRTPRAVIAGGRWVRPASGISAAGAAQP